VNLTSVCAYLPGVEELQHLQQVQSVNALLLGLLLTLQRLRVRGGIRNRTYYSFALYTSIVRFSLTYSFFDQVGAT